MFAHKQIRLFNIQIDALSMTETVECISHWLSDEDQSCRYVVTPNVDHIVQLETNERLHAAYRAASLVVVDGKPVAFAAKLLGKPVPGTVPGSDLAPAIFDDTQKKNQPLKVFLLGAMPGVADRAKHNIERHWPCVKVVGTLSPVFGFEKDEKACAHICQTVNDSGAQLLLLGLGAPKQELWIERHASMLHVNVALCIGATIDFLAGEKARAPLWMRNMGLEWLHRACTEPKRLAKRYLKDAVIFPRLIYKEWRGSGKL